MPSVREGPSTDGSVLAFRPDLGPPRLNDGFDLLLIFIGIEWFRLPRQADEDRRHVGGDDIIDPKQLGRIETAEAVGVPPGQEERCNASGLPCIALCDL